MAIGEFGGAPAVPGSVLTSTPLYWDGSPGNSILPSLTRAFSAGPSSRSSLGEIAAKGVHGLRPVSRRPARAAELRRAAAAERGATECRIAIQTGA